MDTTTQSTDRKAAFHSDDVESLGEYRTLSVLALVSLLIGLAAPLAFAAPLARTIPLIGIGVALVAMRRIAVSGGVLAGRWAATVGLALSIASLLAVLSYGQVLRYLQTRQAEEFGRGWLATLQSGDTQRAFRLTAHGAQPEPPPAQPGGPPAKNPYDEFLADRAIELLVQSAARGAIVPRKIYSYEARGAGQCWVGQRFAIMPGPAISDQAGTTQEQILVDLLMQLGRLTGEGRPRWLVVSHKLAESASDDSAGHDEGHTH